MKKLQKMSICVALFACSFIFAQFIVTPTFAADRKVLKIAHQAFPPHVFILKTTKHWANLIRERTNGEVELKFFYDTLGKGPGILSASQKGVADGFACLGSFFTGRIRPLAVFELRSYAAPDQYLELVKAIRPVLEKIFAKYGIQYVGALYSYKDIVFTHRSRHFHTPDDFKGQKIRSVGVWGQKTLEALGATPMSILPPELYPAAQRGIIDSVSTIAMLVDVFKLYEVQKYITVQPGVMSSLVMVGMNMKSINKLGPKNKATIIQSGRDAEVFSWKIGRRQEDELLKKLGGLTNLYTNTPGEKKVIDAVISGKMDPMVKGYSGPLGAELMAAIRKVQNRR